MSELRVGHVYGFADLPDGAIYRPCNKSGNPKGDYCIKRSKKMACRVVRGENGKWRRTALQIPFTAIKDIYCKFVSASLEFTSDSHGIVRILYTGDCQRNTP